MVERLLTLKETCKLLGIHPNTLRRWEKEGKIRVVRTPKGRRRIPESEVNRLMGIGDARSKGGKKRAAVYARVSSHDQKEDLERQKERLITYAVEKGYDVKAILTDIASGLNENRKGLKRLFKLVEEREVDVVVVSYKDRLTRFGFRYLESYFKSHEVEIEVVNGDVHRDSRQELVEDLISLVSSFAGRLYGMRSKKREEVISCVRKAVS